MKKKLITVRCGLSTCRLRGGYEAIDPKSNHKWVERRGELFCCEAHADEHDKQIYNSMSGI